MTNNPFTIPNFLSGLRLAMVPVLLVLALGGRPTAYLTLFVIALMTDMADGFLARRLGQESELGSRMDSWGDFALYMSTPFCAWQLWPDLIAREAPYVIAVLISFTLPVFIGFLKYRRLTSYHTIGAKLSAVLMGISTIILFARGFALPFHISTVVLVVTQVEEICITIVLPSWRANVLTLWHALRFAGRERAKD